MSGATLIGARRHRKVLMMTRSAITGGRDGAAATKLFFDDEESAWLRGNDGDEGSTYTAGARPMSVRLAAANGGRSGS